MHRILVYLTCCLLAAAGAEAQPVVPGGAIARWDFNEGAGDTLHDLTGNRHHGIIHGATWVTGMDGAGKALEFEGEGGVEVPGDSQINVNSFTFSIWLRQSGNSGIFPLLEWQEPNALVGVNLACNTSGWAMSLPGAFYANLRPHDASASQPGEVRERNLVYTAGGTAQGARWNHIVLAYDKDTRRARIHVNGKLQAQRDLDPFTPRTTGSLLLGFRSKTSQEWLAGTGLIGILDEAALYGRALSEAEIGSLYGKGPVEPKSIHLGMKTHNAKAGDTVIVPVYISSEGRDSLSALQFNLDFDTTVATLLDVQVDTAVAAGWEVKEFNRGAGSPVAVGLAGTSRIVGAAEGELLRLTMKVVPGALDYASTMITLTGILADEGRVGAVSHTPGRIFVVSPSILYGDVTGDDAVDTIDARVILMQVVGRLALPSPDYPDFTLAVADVSGNGAITSYDAALVLQYGLGILDEFPVERKQLAKRSAAAANLALSAPVKVEGNTWRYRIRGSGLEGLIAGELWLQAGASVTSIARVGSPLAGIRISHRHDAAGQLRIALACNRRVAAGEVDFLEVDAVHGNGSAPGLSFKSAWLNEGRLIATGMDSQPLSIDAQIIPAVPPNGLRIGRVGDVLRLSVPGVPLRAIEIRAPDGRRLLSRRYEVPVSTAVLDVGAFPASILLLKAEGIDGGVRNGILAPFRP
jgi:hypothetical protein